MRLQQALHSDRITIDLAVSDRAQALTSLACAFAACDPRLDAGDVGDALQTRERLSSTNVGGGVAIPHARVRGLGSSQLAVSIVEDGVAFDDGAVPVRILVGVLSDTEDPRAHLALLASLARALSVPQVRQGMIDARTVEAVIAALAQEHAGGVVAKTSLAA